MADRFPPSPKTGAPLATTPPSAAGRLLLALRRSARKAMLGPPGPSPHAVDELLRVAARAPDHRRVEPWRFLVFEGEARETFGAALAGIRSRVEPETKASELEEDRARFLRAPVVVAVVSSPDPAHKTPVWEQELSAGAVCHNLSLAANAAGWSSVWLTEWPAYDSDVAALLGLKTGERIAGFLYIGTARAPSPERARPDLADKIRRWTG